MDATAEQDKRFAAIGAAAAEALRSTEYRRVRTQDVAARVRLDSTAGRRSPGGARSAVWLYNEVRSRRVLVALGAAHAWNEYLSRTGERAVPVLSGPGGFSRPSGVDQALSAQGSDAVDAEDVTAAVDSVARALTHVIRFHQAQSFLVAQVASGIGDIATSEKSDRSLDQAAPLWPDSHWGRLAAAAYEGRCTVYADFLAPVVLRATRAVVPLGGPGAFEQAASLSDLVFRGLAGTVGSSTERVAAGFAAYWFERDLVSAAGGWARDLFAAELDRNSARAHASDRYAVRAARRRIIRILIDADTLYERAARESGIRWKALTRGSSLDPRNGGADDDVERVVLKAAELQGATPGSTVDVTSLRELCDTASRHGLALLRYGDLDAATTAFRATLFLAAGPFARHDKVAALAYEARANHNLAEVAMAEGDDERAVEACESAHKTRAALLESLPAPPAAAEPAAPPDDDSAARRGWAAARRRFLLTAELRIRLMARIGRPAEAVHAAEQLLWREPGEQRQPEVAARLRATFGEVLLEAGHPLEARHHLEAARLALLDGCGDMMVGLHELANRLRLARAALVLRDHDGALAMVPDESTLAWCAEHVSFRAAAEARRLRALAWSDAGQHEDAGALLDFALAELRRQPGCSAADAELASLDHTRAITLYRAGKYDAAYTLLEKVLADQHKRAGARIGPFSAWTLTWLARAAEALADDEAAFACFGQIEAATATDLEPTHPVVLEAGLDQAERLVRAGDFAAAARLIEPALDDRPLVHGRPALERGHPLRDRAHRLAQTLGLRTEPQRRRWDDEY